MGKVLIVEDDELLLSSYNRKLKADGVDVLLASTNQEAMQIFEREKGNLVCIAFDGFLQEGDTLDLITKIKQTFNGTMIATSSHRGVLKTQLKNGCQMQVDFKADLPNLILSIINGTGESL